MSAPVMSESGCEEQSHPEADCKPFSPHVVAVLQSLYQRGMTGWGIKHSEDLESAVKSTGLNLSQVKVCILHDCKISVHEEFVSYSTICMCAQSWIRRRNMKRRLYRRGGFTRKTSN